MRVRLLEAWPALSKHFQLMPWHIDLISPRELEQYLDALDEIAREASSQG